MQLISHTNTQLTLCQKFFIEKSLELLHLASIDSYRVRFNNPITVLMELRYCLAEFESGRIKHFNTIKAKDKKAIVNEAIEAIDSEPNYLVFNSISREYLKSLLNDLDEKNYKRLIYSLDMLLKDNTDYRLNVLSGLEGLIGADNDSLDQLEKIDYTLNILYAGCIHSGFAKGFLYKLCYGIFVNTFGEQDLFDERYQKFKERLLLAWVPYKVVFRIDTTKKVYSAISGNAGLTLSDNVDGIPVTPSHMKELATFNRPSSSRKFITCEIEAADYLAALRKARFVLSEYMDVIDLGLSQESLVIHSRAIVINTTAPQDAGFQNNINVLDGKYKVNKDYYTEFTTKLPSILNSDQIPTETKEKIKSAIRYLRLGNQSTEIEHKFLNYWIGLEYIFSNYESSSTINRLKEHFINAHSIIYVKRNVQRFKTDFEHIPLTKKALIPSYDPNSDTFLYQSAFYDEIAANLNEFPVLKFRALKFKKWFFSTNPPNASQYLARHQSNLEIHFTRIYRLRNEIIHDAATNTNNEYITSNLRYYLTFILNELIDFLSQPDTGDKAIEAYFLLNEIHIGNLRTKKYLLQNLLEVGNSINFIS